MEEKGSAILNGGAVAIILIVVFLSQQPFMRPFGQAFYAWEMEKIGIYTSGAADWVKLAIYPKVSQEVEKRGAPLQQEAITQKNNAVQFIWDKIKNYFAEKFSKTFGTQVK